MTMFSDCAMDVELGDLPADMNCKFGASCSMLSCCLHSSLLQRNFEVNVTIDPCSLQMTLSIEKLEFDVSLIGYTWGKI